MRTLYKYNLQYQNICQNNHKSSSPSRLCLLIGGYCNWRLDNQLLAKLGPKWTSRNNCKTLAI